MSWPATSGVTTGYTAAGVTTLRWGTDGMITSTATVSASFAIVLRFSERQLVEDIQLPNGTGIPATRVLIKDGVQWNVTIRDDTRITGLPAVGTAVVLVDAGGLINGYNAGAAYSYTGVVVDTGYDTAPKQAGERTITIENLVLVDSQSAA